jgi:DNA-binding response OmpR family regulator
MSEPLIAVVDDDVTHLAMVQRVLFGKAKLLQFGQAETLLQSEALPLVHLIILDWNLPGMNGLEALKAIRAHHLTPVLFLTSFDAEARVVAALGAGADDYLVKPFRAGELNARIQTLLRRYQTLASKLPAVAKKLHPSIHIDQTSSSVQLVGHEPIKLSNKEFLLAQLFFQNVGRSLPRDEIVQTVWGRGQDIPSRTLDTHVSRLRARLNLRPEAGWRLTPVYSFGYRLDVRDESNEFGDSLVPTPTVIRGDTGHDE